MNLIKTTALTAIALLLSACSSTPQDAITNTFDALKEGHFPKLMKNTTYPISKAYASKALATCSVDKSKYENDDIGLMNICLIQEYKDIKIKKITIKSISENKAEAEVTVMYKEEITYKYEIHKIDNQWRLAPPNYIHKDVSKISAP